MMQQAFTPRASYPETHRKRSSLQYESNQYQIRSKPMWVEKHLESLQCRSSVELSLEQNFDKRTSIGTVTTISTEIGSHNQEYLSQNMDDPIEEEFSSSDESTQPRKASNKSSNPIKKKDYVKFKTEMCKNWSVMGKCNYGRKCQFAHGLTEMKQEIISNNKYRSKLCKSFHQDLVFYIFLIFFIKFQVCQYGIRCQFQHEQRTLEEIKKDYGVRRSQYLNPDIQLKNRQRLKSLEQIVWKQEISYKQCMQIWIQQSQGLLFHYNSSSSSSE